MTKIELSEERDESNEAAVMLAKLKGAKVQETVDSDDVARFCDRLRDLTYRSYADNLANPDMTPLPRGYRNVRIHDARDGEILGSIWWVGSAETTLRAGRGFRTMTERPTAQRIISILLCRPLEEVTAWRSTTVMASAEQGTLDLLVNIETRPRELLMINGEPLSPETIAFLACRAPAKAIRVTR